MSSDPPPEITRILRFLNSRLDLVEGIRRPLKILPQTYWNGQLVVHEPPVLPQVLPQLLLVQYFLLVQKQILQMGQHLRITLYFRGEILHFRRMHFSLILQVPLLQELDHSVLVFIQHEDGHFSLPLFILGLILPPPQSLDFSLFLVEQSFLIFRFKQEFVLVV